MHIKKKEWMHIPKVKIMRFFKEEMFVSMSLKYLFDVWRKDLSLYCPMIYHFP